MGCNICIFALESCWIKLKCSDRLDIIVTHVAYVFLLVHLAAGSFTCLLKYLVKDCDPATGETDDEGYDDEYALEDVDVTVADYMQRVSLANFAAAWEELGPEHELEDTFALSHMTYLEGKFCVTI